MAAHECSVARRARERPGWLGGIVTAPRGDEQDQRKGNLGELERVSHAQSLAAIIAPSTARATTARGHNRAGPQPR